MSELVIEPSDKKMKNITYIDVDFSISLSIVYMKEIGETWILWA